MAKTTTTTTVTTKTTKKPRILIAVCLDRTGSMSSCREQTVSGFNEFLHQQQRDVNGKAFFSLTLFDQPGLTNDIERRFVSVPIDSIPDLGTTDNLYEPRGMTPLYDAIGATIADCDIVAHKYDSIIVAIQTDGGENASREYDCEKVHSLITKRRKDGWAFLFMGADIDAYTASAAIGVARNSTMSYAGAQSVNAFAATSGAVHAHRHVVTTTLGTPTFAGATMASASNMYNPVAQGQPTAPQVGGQTPTPTTTMPPPPPAQVKPARKAPTRKK